ncbi:MAG: ImmA/IrrE family metallo-endopeptidase [Halanaerobiales bacterium]|nr:ImmA/IrrE family metallo-endopeptidase [Halanaerobiales bacterium]
MFNKKIQLHTEYINDIIERNNLKFPIDVFKLLNLLVLENDNFKRKPLPLPASRPAMLIRRREHSGEKVLLAYDDSRPECEIRFSILHEIYHYLYHTTTLINCFDHDMEDDEREIECNQFALNILAPEQIFLAYYIKFDFNVKQVAAEMEIPEYWANKRLETLQEKK